LDKGFRPTLKPQTNEAPGGPSFRKRNNREKKRCGRGKEKAIAKNLLNGKGKRMKKVRTWNRAARGLRENIWGERSREDKENPE